MRSALIAFVAVFLLAAASLAALPFDDASFDLVAATDVVEHVADDVGALRELLRVTRPGGHLVIEARGAVVVNRAGQQYSGRIRNEDNFSVQLQSLDGTFLFFLKSDIQHLEYNSQPLMPSNYGSTLSPKDLDDLVSFLISSAKTSEPELPGKVDE